MKYRIVADSSSNILTMDFDEFASVPMHIQVGNRHFSDDPSLDIDRLHVCGCFMFLHKKCVETKSVSSIGKGQVVYKQERITSE